jgi:hypothetical protein
MLGIALRLARAAVTRSDARRAEFEARVAILGSVFAVTSVV